MRLVQTRCKSEFAVLAGVLIAAVLSFAYPAYAQAPSPFGLLSEDGSILRNTDAPSDSGAEDQSTDSSTPQTAAPASGKAASSPAPSAGSSSRERAFQIQRAIASDLLDPGVTDEIQRRVTGWISRLNAIEVSIQRGNLTSDQLLALETRVSEIDKEADSFLKAARPLLSSINQRLDGLKVTTDSNQAEPTSESESLTRQRNSLEAVQNVLGSFIKQVEVVKIQAFDLSGRISVQRRRAFVDRLLVRTDSFVAPELWRSAAAEVPKLQNSLKLLLIDWYSLIRQKVGTVPAIFILVGFVGALISIWPLRRRLLKHADRQPDMPNPSAIRRSSAALAMVLLATAVPVVFWVAFHYLINFLDVAPPRVENAVSGIFTSGTFAAFSLGLATAVLAPSLPDWRLLPVSDRTAQRLYRHILIAVPFYTLGILMSSLLNVLFAEDSSKLMVGGLMAITTSLFVMRGLRIVASDRDEEEESPDDVQTGILSILGWIAPLFWGGALFSIGAVLSGYIWFGWFVAAQLVWVLLLFGLTHLLLQFVDDALSSSFKYGTPVARALRNSMGFKSQTTEQVGVVLSGVLRLLITIFALFSLIVPWGFTTGDIQGMFRPILSELRLGSLRFSLTGIFGAIIVFGVVFSLTRASKRWLEDRFLPKTRMDVGLKSSISTGFGYIGVIFATLLALAYAGVNLQNIAIVAGALSVGIGLGLQGIVNNFVSGLIMLAERPIKVGDWVVVGTDQGYVRRINVRATEIETFERSTVIVPNSNLISGVVKNWMHGSSLGRVIVPVRVSFDTDPEVVRDILHAAAKNHPKVTSYPPPDVFFMAFGESGLNFELRCYLPDINDFLVVSSDLHFDVFQRLREKDIEIPFPQRDLHLRSGFDAQAHGPRVEAVDIKDIEKPE
ncbi:small-conductance mechanosensitive channel [Roseibium hamelinense]|uniref:Small-conductance mechanosensitive channel n=1 Tax=Roseibium hamelinense TaxID=150831 RepID=A0A562SKZ7_9HYPH|nr:DUF3772 domain-containing protein [Roseibium hamelinense]TWI81838.1 small-conductance mechanosensitive channel [Roseibium hamelinense]